MNKKIIIYFLILLICMAGLVSSFLNTFMDTYLLQYIGLSHAIAGGIHAINSLIIVIIVMYYFREDHKQKNN